MFWLLSLLIPSLRRESEDRTFDNFSTVFKTAETRGILFKVVGMLLAAGFIWWLIAGFLSLFNAWFVVLLALVMGATVGYLEWRNSRRENWIQTGHCANCGYDLRATPDRCPECGRDVHLDEPIWKRMRRELEAKLLAQSETDEDLIFQNQDLISNPDGTVKPKVVIKPPPIDDAPIPLEGD